MLKKGIGQTYAREFCFPRSKSITICLRQVIEEILIELS